MQISIIMTVVLLLEFLTPQLKWRMSEKVFQYLLRSIFFLYNVGNLYFTILSRTPSPYQRIELMPFSSLCRIRETTQEKTVSVLIGALAKFFLNSDNAMQGII